MTASPQDPPGFATRSELEKAAWDNGFRLDDGLAGGWLQRRSTTASGRILLGARSNSGPWLLALGHPGVWHELAGHYPRAEGPAPVGAAGVLQLANLGDLHAALTRAYQLGRALPDAPLERFNAQAANLPRSTEAERLIVQRIGQDVFRDALMHYWGGRCPLTGITDPPLLRASHIVPWAACESDAQRLDVHNGLLLAAHWDAAFDAGLVGFDDAGRAVAAPALSTAARDALGLDAAPALPRLTEHHRQNLAWHRNRYGLPEGTALVAASNVRPQAE